MKTHLGLCLGVVLMFASPQPFFGQTVKTDSPLAAQKSQPSFSITKRDANSRVWERTTYERSPSGQLVPKKHSYTELATGMHYKDANGQWVESKEEIEVFPGGAIARQGQYQVIFANNLNTAGAIDMQMPDGKRLRSHILSLNYFDTATGNNVPLAEVKDCIGQIVGSNQVLYADAFTGIRASVRYTYRKGSFEQDVILMEQPPVPEAYGLNSASTKLQVLTEFLNPPEPKRVDRTPKGSSRNSAAIAAKNEDLDFGAMKIGRGRAFAWGEQKSDGISVSKQFLKLDGRDFLLEEVSVPSIKQELEKLPAARAAAIGQTNSIRRMASTKRLLPAPKLAQTSRQPMLQAKVDFNSPGYVMDYIALIDYEEGDYTFQGGQTYYLPGSFGMAGDAIFEAGTVVKFGVDPCPQYGGWGLTLWVEGNVIGPTDGMAILTSVNDDSRGETIEESTGQPSPGCVYFEIPYGTPQALRNLEFHFAALGAFLPAASSVENCIFDLCSTGIAMDGGDVTLTGVTFYDVNVMIYFWANTPSDGQIVNAQNVQGIVCGDFVQTSPDLNLNYMALTLNNCCFDSLGQDLAGYGQAIQSAGGSFSWTPCVAGDYDGDGMPDSWEEQHFGNTDQTGTDDYDGDGVNNLQEYNNGINSTDPNKIRFAIEVANNYVNTSSTSVELDVTKGVPSSMAILVDSTNFAGATWTSYDANPSIYLGTNQGWHEIWIGLRGRLSTSQQTWEEVDFNLDTIAPVVVITNPVVVTTNSAGSIVTQPYLQLQGYANEQLQEIYFDVTNAAGVFTNEQGFVTDQGFDTNLFDFTTNYFQCYDVPLTNGLNRITVRVTDLAGNTTTTNINVTLDYSSKTPPVIKLFWPQNGEKISGDSFTWRGWVDDFTATVSASIVSTNGETNVVQGLVERDGNFWVENLPMPNGTNLLTLTVTDIATNICSTNITVSTSPVTVTMTPIDDNQLWQPRVSAHGEIISGSTYFLWINGVKATVNGNAWSADNVPMTAGGTAVFNITLYEPGETQPDNSTGN